MASNTFPVAVIGMAVNLPNAKSCEEFWNLLVDGQDTVGEFPEERIADVSHVLARLASQLVDENKPFFTGSFFKCVDKFDANFFQISPKEALFIEPEQRIFLETVWQLLEDAGYASSIKGSNTGVYVGNTVNKYKYILTVNHPSISHGNHSPFISSRVSYTHDLQGPAMMVATGCSSSLLAVHVACQGLLSGDCEMAIAGGITLDLLPVSTKTDIWNQLGITGPGVKCRAFDADASGIAKGEGCGAVLLKPFSKAVSDGDHIYGVLQATTANQDGHSNGITAPHPGAQTKMLHRAWKLADISPNQLEYFEAHGTGTELGDPIEISGITNAIRMFETSRLSQSHKIPIGSVKANIGHLADGAAGIVSLIKTLMCMHKCAIPPSVNFKKPNPHINWSVAPVYVNTTNLEWKPHGDKSPRFASVSAFGLLGTNVHAVVKEYIECSPSRPLLNTKNNDTQILALAANSEWSLVEYISKLLEYFKCSNHETNTLKHVCFTINTGREQSRFSHRAIAHASSWHDMIHALDYLLQNLTKHIQCDSNTEYTSMTSIGKINNTKLACELTVLAENFLNRKSIDWKKFYSDVPVQSIPLLPTYVFDRIRYWPEIKLPVNKELLFIENKEETPSNTSQLPTSLQPPKKLALQCQSLLSSVTVQECISASLNEVLNMNHEWHKEMGKTNLFSLGVDSLMFTQLSMKVHEKLGCHLSLTEFHNNPTFLELKQLILSKTAEGTRDKHSCYYSSTLLKDILNKTLGKDHDWLKLKDTSLFTLGVDSLIFTQISLKLTEVLNLHEPLTLSELHEKPTFTQLCNIIESKFSDQIDAVHAHYTPGSVSSDRIIVFPPTLAQRRLWMMQEMIGSNSCVYNVTNCLKISGNFHINAFILALKTVLSSHCAFNTIFVDTPDGPKQQCNLDQNVDVEEINLIDQKEDAVMFLYDKDYRMSFDLRYGQLVRCKLYHLANTHYFTMVAHHIIFDGWSHFVFYNELWQKYNMLSEARVTDTSHPPDLSVREEIRVYTSTSESVHIGRELSFWMQKLSEPLPYTSLPGDKRRPPVFTHKGSRTTRLVDFNTQEKLKTFCEDQCTMFTILLSAVNVLIYLYTGEKDIIVGTPIAGRNNLKLNHIIGCFVNTLPLRVGLEDNYDFKKCLQVITKICLEAYDHQSLPFEQLVSNLNLSRDTSITPVFSINVCYHNTELRGNHIQPLADIHVERKLLHNDSAKWDLYFDFLEEPEGLRFTLEYYSDAFSDSYAQDIADNLLHLFEYIVQYPSIPISSINLVSGKSVLHGPSRSIGEKTLPVLLLDSLKLHAKDSFIFNVDDFKYAYDKLRTDSEILSVFLRKTCGLPKQSKVGLLLENSLQTLVSILACVFTGLIYVPLDPNSPKPRLEYICKEANISAIIFSAPYLSVANHIQWTCTSTKTLVCIDSESFNDLQEDTYGSPLMDAELWDSVASDAKDDIEGGGWKSSFTGEYMSVDEMKDYTKNVYEKIKVHLTEESTILEIGCASGLTTQTLAPYVSHYVASDMSLEMIKNLQAKLIKLKVSNVECICMSADKIGDSLKGKTFDVIVMNSVVHCFPGHNYLRNVLVMCEQLLNDTGIIFVGDVLDLDLKHKLVASLKSFKEANPGLRVKTEWHNDLFLSKHFFYHICASSAELNHVTCSRKLYTVRNELTDYRFDAILSKRTNSDIDIEGDMQSDYRTYAIKDISAAVQLQDDQLHELVSLFAGQIDFTDNIYLLYTSGTTGNPKGVLIGHEAILNYTLWGLSAYKFDKMTTLPLYSPITFDFTLTSIYPPLLCGSTIYIFKNFEESYLSIASNRNLTLAKFSPLQLGIILSEVTESLSPSTFIVGGEELSLHLLSTLKKNKSDQSFVVWNEYGPTECTVGSVVKCFFSDDLPLHESQLCSIGRPIDNVTIAVVKDKCNPVPIGGRGILCIGGKCLCSDFAESKSVFKVMPLESACWGSPGELMYVTDDVAAVMPSTFDLAYFGREIDSNAAKVNGVRVDILEIQYSIEEYPLIQNAWICSFVYNNCAYLGAAVKFKTISVSNWKPQLVSYLSSLLPLRSIPKVFVAITDPPVNRNGKKNIALLRRLFVSELQTASTNEITGETNKQAITFKLQKIWQSILPITHLPAPDDDFFLALSGDSLQAIHLVRKMRDEGFLVCVPDIFRNPSIHKLQSFLESNATNSLQSVATEVECFKPTPIIEEYFTRSPPLKFPDRYSLPALLRFHGEIEDRILRKVLNAVMEKHASLRSKFECTGGEVRQSSTPIHHNQPEVISLDITGEQNSNLYNEPQFKEICFILENKLSLTDGTLLNACIINYYSADHERTKEVYVLIVVHHVAIDIVSWQQVLVDISAALRQINVEEVDCHKTLSLEKCMLPFSTFCEHLHAEVVDGVFTTEVPFWKGIEKKVTKAGSLGSHSTQGTFKSAYWFCKSMNADILRSTATTLGCSDEHILLTALGRSCSSIHGCDLTAICLESHGRQLSTIDSTDTVGWCTSKFPYVLDCPLIGDVVDQVNAINENLSSVPNRGLGFGVLKSAGKLTLRNPNMMVVYQGSLDASTKESFDGGIYNFDCIPWIEVMLSELEKRHFHRHTDELLEFDIEVIAWIHGGKLKVGCLYNVDVVSHKIIEDVINGVHLILDALARKIATRTDITLTIIPCCSIPPHCEQSLTNSLRFHNIFVSELNVHPQQEPLLSLYTLEPKNTTVTNVMVFIVRIETEEQAAEFLTIYDATKAQRTYGICTIINIGSQKNLSVDLNQLDSNVLYLSEYISETTIYDHRSDIEYNMPFTQEGYVHLGLIIARAVRGTLILPKYKVIAVDADYTLWDGECVEGHVSFNEGNIILHKYLHKLKEHGVLLVILSKNKKQDVEEMLTLYRDNIEIKTEHFVAIIANWEKKTDNIHTVAKILNLNLDSFIFVDDNPVECEEMIKSHPDVLTLQFPQNQALVSQLLNSIWDFDSLKRTSESTNRTKMYKEEFRRQEEMHKIVLFDDTMREVKLIEILSKWKMNLIIMKTSVAILRRNKRIYDRASELLYRTNQFKMNDVNVKLDSFPDDDTCWIVYLNDCHGSYGIISVAVLSNYLHEFLTLAQWTLSCRALGREVEYRILSEIYKDKPNLHITVNETGRNNPALKFLDVIGCNIVTLCGKELVQIAFKSDKKLVVENLHSVTVTSNIEEFETLTTDRVDRINEPDPDQYGSGDAQRNSSLWNLYQWINEEWSSSQKQQGAFHNMFPIIPQCKNISSHKIQTSDHMNQDETKNGVGSVVHFLKSTWMKILNLDREPKDSDHFIELGGNSFGAVFLVSKLRRLCCIEVNLMDLLQNPTYGCFKEIVLNPIKLNQTTTKFSKNVGVMPLSAAQLRMIIMQQTAPHSTAYVETVACITKSTALASEEVFKKLVEMHPILAMRIKMKDDTADYIASVNETLMNLKPPIEVVADLTTAGNHLTDTIPTMKALDAPLVKFRHLYLTSENASILAVHVHHTICDEITLLNISSSLEFLLFNKSKQPSSRQHYSQYIQHERQYLMSHQYILDDSFWKSCYLDLPPESSLSILPPSLALWNDAKVYNARRCKHMISNDAIQQISQFCTTLGITHFHYYLSCTLLVLHSYLGVKDIVLAIPVTTRDDLHQNTDGLFVNTLLFRMVIDVTITFTEFTKNVARKWIKALGHKEYPIDHVVRNIWKEHSKNSTSFCTVMFNYSERKKKENELSIYSKHAKMPLSIDVLEERYEVATEWAAELIHNDIAARLADSIAMVYSKAMKMMQKISDLNVLSQHELQILQSFNPQPTKLEQQTIIQRFEHNVMQHAGSIALVFGEIVLTYAELNTLASNMANCLSCRIQRTELTNNPVIIVMEKDRFTIAAVLAVWKAGGHFLPVSAINARATLKDIVRQITPAAVLTNIEFDTSWLEDNENTFSIMKTEDLISYSSVTQDLQENTSDNLAYVIRTSGSTGKPKQCKVSQISLSVLAKAWQQQYKMDKFDVIVLQWAPLSFDVFIGDIVRGLICAPGQLIICPENQRLNVPYIINLIKKHKISIVEVTPQFGTQIVENSGSSDLDSLNLFILGSDVLQSHVFNAIKQKLRSQRVINSYGMTEATIDSSFFESDSLPLTRSGTVPIGKPLPGVEMHILNSRTLQLCPVGTVGELYISGNVLASGDVELVNLKHKECVGLKTGDAACWLPSGDIELIGRLNDMVKLRGFRISTTEIENKIIDLVTNVKEVCVLPMTNTDGIEFLCAFVLVKNNVNKETFNKESVCSHLRGELPYYMLPDLVHIIDKMPLTAHGKVDHKSLPSISELIGSSAVVNTDSSSSNMSVVTSLKELLAEAMGMSHSEGILTEQTFMEQGAHSLILIRFSTLIQQKTNYAIEISDLFSYPSITSLADYITNKVPLSTELPDTVNRSEQKLLAITGIGLRLPGGVMSLPELWKVLDSGNELDLINDFPPARAADVLNCLPHSVSNTLSRNTFKGAFLEQINGFDNTFFKIAPGEAKFMSPEQRVFLQVATEALIESKKASHIKGAKIGVFVSSSEVGYSQLNHPDEATCISGLMPGMIATRVAYQWDLKGPTMLIDTACSSSLVALKLACDSIQNNECDSALVGGISFVLYPARVGVHGQSSILSPDFHCRALDKEATGTAVGEGVFCLHLEPIATALQEEKPIYGIIKGAAINSVGHGNSITAPTSKSQEDVIRKALAAAQILPSDITYIETHGTGTKLGDKIELSALKSVFKVGRSEMLPIGSAKSNFGHLDAAAGLLGVFKVLAQLKYGKIAPTAHFKTPHPEISSTSLYIINKTIPWEANEHKLRIAGVSSFGLTGTNCHTVIAEFQNESVSEHSKHSDNGHHLLFCGHSLDHIKKQICLYAIYLRQIIQNNGESEDILSSLCFGVAKRLQKLSDMKLVYNHWRVTITALNIEQVLNVFSIVNDIKTIDALVKLVKMRNDIQMFSPEYYPVLPTCTNTAIYKFLVDAEVDIDQLFNGCYKEIKSTTGITLAMFRESRHWLEYTPTSQINSEELIDLFERKLLETRETVRELELTPNQEVRELQGKFCCAIIIRYFLGTDLAEYLKQNHVVSYQSAFNLSGMARKYDKLFHVMIRELQDNDLVITNTNKIGMGSTLHFQCQHHLDTDLSALCTYAAQTYPAWADCFRFPLYCSKYLPEVLQGRMSPLSVIYPKGDLNFMHQFNKLGDLLGDVYYNMYMQLIADYAKQLSTQGRVRLLEVGAGVGHVTRQLLPKLKDTPNVEYWFTDLGKSFVENAKSLFADYLSMMRFCVFDITKSAPAQGLFGSFDIVVSYNVIHTTESIMKSVSNLKSCLGEDGTLFIIESAKNETWATLAWGILDGWWFFKDYDLRPYEPMMEPNKWEKVLVDAGFSTVRSCPINEMERSHVEKFLFICSNKTLVRRFNVPHTGWWETDLHKFDSRSGSVTISEQEESSILVIDQANTIYDELKRIWIELLGTETIKPDDDFSFLGGESLLAIQMINLVHKKIGYQLEIADTFGYPTLQALTDFIADRMGTSTCESKFNKPTTIEDESNDQNTNQLSAGIMIMFPGQGSQKVGMCATMKDSPEAKAIFSKAEEILGYNILDICTNDSSELKRRLTSTEFVQVAIFVGCIAKLEQLKKEKSMQWWNRVTHIAGLSVGEFVALVATNAIGFEDALRLVQFRGKAMEEAVKKRLTSMVSVFGPSCIKLREFLKRNFPFLEISTYLADNQHTVAGTDEDCDALIRMLHSTEYKEEMDVIDVRKLHVAGAFHSSFMKKAAEDVDPVVKGLDFFKPSITLIMNANGKTVDDPEEIKDLLCKQLVEPVQWKRSIITAYESGVRSFVEIAPSRVLSSIVKKRISVCSSCTVEFVAF